MSSLLTDQSEQCAGVAQLVEQRIRNAKVEGSIPFTGTKNSLENHRVIQITLTRYE